MLKGTKIAWHSQCIAGNCLFLNEVDPFRRRLQIKLSDDVRDNCSMGILRKLTVFGKFLAIMFSNDIFEHSRTHLTTEDLIREAENEKLLRSDILSPQPSFSLLMEIFGHLQQMRQEQRR